MPDNLYIYDGDNVKVQVQESNDVVTIIGVNEYEQSVIEIIEPGPQGPRGEDGAAQIPNLVVTSSQQINFYLIENAPFYPIVSGSLFGTTSSFSFFGTFSSSLLPWSSSFDIGSSTNPWKNVFVSNSIFIGSTKITTSSFGFDDYIIKKITNTQQIMKIESGSVSASFNSSGVFTIPDFDKLPNITRGGLVVSGSDFFVGI